MRIGKYIRMANPNCYRFGVDLVPTFSFGENRVYDQVIACWLLILLSHGDDDDEDHDFANGHHHLSWRWQTQKDQLCVECKTSCRWPIEKKNMTTCKKNILDSELSQVHIHLIWSNLQNIIGFAPVVFLGRGMFQARLRNHFWSKKYENVSTSVVGRSSESNLRLLPVLLLSMVNHGTVSVQHGHLATPESTAHRHRWWQSQT